MTQEILHSFKASTVTYAVMQACGESDYTFGTTAANNLASVYKMAAPGGCQLAVCARFPTQVTPPFCLEY